MIALYTPFLAGTVSTQDAESLTQTVKDIDSLSGTISNYGPLIVICSAFILTFFLMFLMFMRIFKNMTDKLLIDSSNNDEHKTATGDHDTYGDDENHIYKHDPLEAFIQHSLAFKGATKVAMERLAEHNIEDCDRIAIYVFHNGNKSLYGLPFIKISCIHEETRTGMNTIRGRDHKNLPLNLFDDIVNIIYEKKEFACDADDEFWENGKLQEFIEGSKTKALFIDAIVTDDDQIAGFISCEFSKTIDVHDEYKHNKIKEILQDLNRSIRYIILNERKK